jgi:hypothetical protein
LRQADVKVDAAPRGEVGSLYRRNTDIGVRPTRVWRSLVWTSVCGAAVTAMLAITAPGGAIGRVTPSACPTLQETTSDGAPSARLLSMLGVLRRPQTAEDTLPAPLNPGDPPRFGEGIYVKYIRLARLVAGVKYYIVPVAKGRGPQCDMREGVSLETVEAIGQASGGVVTAKEIENGKLTGARWIGGGGVEYGVVPNGVAKVTLRFPSASGKRGLRASVTVSPKDNIYVATVPPAASGPLPVSPKTVIWRSRKGSVLKTFHY